MNQAIREAAAQVFLRTPKTHNCAQSVAELAGRADLLPELAGCGGGRAPEGRCGALHAALLLTPEAAHDRLTGDFVAAVGAAECRRIKQETGTPCVDCVAVAAELAERYRS